MMVADEKSEDHQVIELLYKHEYLYKISWQSIRKVRLVIMDINDEG